MEEIIYPINLDLRTNTHKVLVMKEGDYNSRVIEATITNNGKPFNIDNCTVDIKWRKPDGHIVYSEATKIDLYTIRVVCTEQMLCVSGISVAEIVITDSNSVVSTLTFNISVNETVASDFDIESSDEFSSLRQMKEHIANNDIHIPEGGTAGQIVVKDENGNVTWGEVAHITSEERSLWNTVSNKANSEHSHNYAGSSSAGGSANSSIKLDSSAGSATQPVYFKDGKPVATTHTLEKSVPSDAKFTDTTYSSLKNPYSLTVQANGTSLGTYDGSSAKTFNITASGVGAAAANHSHNYAGSSSAGGAATTALACTGNAATATKATNDGNGNNIANTYVTKTNPKTTGYFLHDNSGSSADNSCAVIAGQNSQAKGNFSTAMCYESKALANYSNAWGAYAQASGEWSYAIGAQANASNTNAMAIGYKANASGGNAIVLGSESTASGNYSTAIGGNNNTASGSNSTVLGGSYSNAAGKDSIAAGLGITTQNYQFAIGYQNNTSNTTATTAHGSSSGTIFTIGNGTSDSKSNAFRVQGDGKVYAKGAYSATGADYAEFAEWADGNRNNEDRRGYFVTFDEENPTMIRKANAGEYILGIVSGNPCIIGNGDEDWRGRYIFDEFGSFIMETEDVEIEKKDEVTGEVTTETITITKYKENPNYDNNQKYVPRAERQEWAAVGWIGVLSVYDDGTCKVGGYCKVADGGIATKSERDFDTYRVLERVTDNVVKIALK